MKKDKKQITEEELASYIDGRLAKSRVRDLESSLTDDTLELIAVTRAAIEEVPSDNVVIFPKWNDIAASPHPFFRQLNPLAMAGFLGDEDDESVAEPTAENAHDEQVEPYKSDGE